MLASFLVQAFPPSNLVRMHHIQISVYHRLIFLHIRAQRCRLTRRTCHCCFSRWNGFGLNFNARCTLWVRWTKACVHASHSGKHLPRAEKEKSVERRVSLPVSSFLPIVSVKMRRNAALASPSQISKAGVCHRAEVKGGRKAGSAEEVWQNGHISTGNPRRHTWLYSYRAKSAIWPGTSRHIGSCTKKKQSEKECIIYRYYQILVTLKSQLVI